MFERKPEKAVVSVQCGATDCAYNTEGYCQKDYIVIDKHWRTCQDHEEKEEG